jgi:SAM-dependent methyltransferase
MDVTLLWPGRHHLLTKFQHDYLKELAIKGLPDGRKVARIIVAVTSANHDNTRRNPVPLYLRALALEEFARDIPCEVKLYPIKDIQYTDKYGTYMLGQIFYQSGERLLPENTMLACSTPSVVAIFKALGFGDVPMELTDPVAEKYGALRPFEVTDLLVKAGSSWRDPASEWQRHASPATVALYLEYNLGDLIIEVFKDSLLSDDADITDTRDYQTYVQGMDAMTDVKFNDIAPFVTEGKIVDVGCSTGSLIQCLAKHFPESDIIGIEAVRRFYEYCKMQEYANPFVFFYRRNVTDQNFKENTINTFIYSSVLHEVYSYIGESALHDVIQKTYLQLISGGRIIIRDVVGPEHPQDEVWMLLNKKDGEGEGDIAVLSTYAKFFRFVKDFKPRPISFRQEKMGDDEYIVLPIQNAYEFMSKMTYVDNWESEMHEEFGYYSFSRWQEELTKQGFSIVEGSKPFHNPYIIDRRYRGNVSLFKKEGDRLVPVDYPPTNMILVGEKS